MKEKKHIAICSGCGRKLTKANEIALVKEHVVVFCIYCDEKKPS